MAITVLLAEDNALLRAGLRGVLEDEPELELVGVCGDLGELEARHAELDPDVVVTDIRMPPTSSDEGIRFARALRERGARTGVVVLSQFEEPEYAIALLEGGAAGRAYLLKDRVGDVGQLVAAVRDVAAGGSAIDPRLVEGLVAARVRQSTSPLSRLTPREREVLAEMAEGRTNTAIAERMVLTVRAVERHINSLFAKLGLADEPDYHRRVRAVLLYLSDGAA